MKTLLNTALVVGALGVAVVGVAGPAIAESPGSTAVGTTIGKLAAKGYRVIVHRVGDAPTDQCSVGQVRPGQTFTSVAPGAGNDNVAMVTSRTVYVDVVC
jgi:hypothetical protein